MGLHQTDTVCRFDRTGPYTVKWHTNTKLRQQADRSGNVASTCAELEPP